LEQKLDGRIKFGHEDWMGGSEAAHGGGRWMVGE
jgi:hypothetical protein